MTEQSVPFLEFVFFICTANLPILSLALFLVVIALRRVTKSWLRVVTFSICWALTSTLTTLVFTFWGRFNSIISNGLLAFYTPALIATFITTAPLFLLRRKEVPISHSRNEA